MMHSVSGSVEVRATVRMERQCNTTLRLLHDLPEMGQLQVDS